MTNDKKRRNYFACVHEYVNLLNELIANDRVYCAQLSLTMEKKIILFIEPYRVIRIRLNFLSFLSSVTVRNVLSKISSDEMSFSFSSSHICVGGRKRKGHFVRGNFRKDIPDCIRFILVVNHL